MDEAKNLYKKLSEPLSSSSSSLSLSSTLVAFPPLVVRSPPDLCQSLFINRLAFFAGTLASAVALLLAFSSSSFPTVCRGRYIPRRERERERRQETTAKLALYHEVDDDALSFCAAGRGPVCRSSRCNVSAGRVWRWLFIDSRGNNPEATQGRQKKRY